MRPARVLLEGRPGVGKTTVARRLVELLRDEGVRVAGFTTEEIREGRRRVGFAVEAISGKRGTLAHIDFPGPPRVGKYGVDLQAFEEIALPQLRQSSKGGVFVVDEIGKMELFSAAFREAVTNLLDRDVAVVATVPVFRHPFTEALKRRADVRVLQVTSGNRDTLPDEFAVELTTR
jgi:nucleoside-triphosphatase